MSRMSSEKNAMGSASNQLRPTSTNRDSTSTSTSSPPTPAQDLRAVRDSVLHQVHPVPTPVPISSPTSNITGSKAPRKRNYVLRGKYHVRHAQPADGSDREVRMTAIRENMFANKLMVILEAEDGSWCALPFSEYVPSLHHDLIIGVAYGLKTSCFLLKKRP